MQKSNKHIRYYVVFILLTILVHTLIFNKCYGQKYFEWRFSNQKLMDSPDASGLHFIGSSYLAGSFDNTGKWWKSDLTTIALGTIWEIKDALIPYERIGFLGGEGFSFCDIQMDLTGIITHRLGVLISNRIKYKLWNFNKIDRKK